MDYIYTLERLNEHLRKGDIVIYGAGDWGKRLVDHVISIDLQDKIIGIVVSKMDQEQSQYRGIRIYEADSFLEVKKCNVIIAVSPLYQEEIIRVVERHNKDFIVLSHDIYWATGNAMDTRKRVPYKGIDFLIPGFTKCGTSSLHKALLSVSDVYLAQKKESQFLSWHRQVEDSKKILIENYFDDIREGQVVGMIEPSFATHAREVYDHFGPDIKLVFLVRDPVSATFSRFKMVLRGNAIVESLYQKYGRFSLEMFDEYVSWDNGKSYGVIISRYIDWIDEFREYYPERQIKLVLFEEMIRKPKEILDEILEFVGSRCEYDNEKFPLVNEGSYVMASLEDYLIAKRCNRLSWEYRTCFENDILQKDACYVRLLQAQKELEKAQKLYDVRILDEQRKKMEGYYDDSVRRLERSFHIDLAGVWF